MDSQERKTEKPIFGCRHKLRQGRPSQIWSSTERLFLGLAAEAIPIIHNGNVDLRKFWEWWIKSIPSFTALSPNDSIDFRFYTTADMKKISWRASGPQSFFIQSIVDFFWSVGTPGVEIDRLNDIGSLLHPSRIGSWIEMSSKGGMDGGWEFPEELSLSSALEAADDGEPLTKLKNWTRKNKISHSFLLSRDMGSNPPQQTEVRFSLPGNNFEQSLATALDAWSTFGIPDIPPEALDLMKSKIENDGDCPLSLSIVMNSTDFVRMGLMCPNPSLDLIVELCRLVPANPDFLASFEGTLEIDGPTYFEFSHLMEGFGYGVYNEGFEVVFHYHIVEERKNSLSLYGSL
eukprot:TRINITY_DN17251_c0_g1_i1.p1 TRINITY_DN17251_c0_g1~~TRINITY_DN17251_c0_g1_i1.p1  ORF type:complete len:346 (+),score=40.30 TRINITY_DN17251_c0_g1_i1:110-1147(+)